MIETESHQNRPAGPAWTAVGNRGTESVATARRGAGCHARRGISGRAAVLIIGALVALTGCETATGDQATGDAQAATATPAAAAGEPAEARLTTDNCQRPDGDKVHFRVGSTVFAVPAGDIRTVVPPGVTPQTPTSEVVARLKEETENGAGCPETPLDAALLAVAGPAGNRLLGDTILLVPSTGGIEQYGELTRQMLANADRCQTPKEGLLACVAVKQDEPEDVRRLYLVATDRNQTLAFGGPMAARCVVSGEQMNCEIVDELPGRVGMRVPLRALPESGAELAAAQKAAVAEVRGLRR